MRHRRIEREASPASPSSGAASPGWSPSSPSYGATSPPAAATVDGALLSQYQSEMSASAAMPLPDEEDSDEAMGFGLFDDGAPAAPAVESPKEAKAKKRKTSNIKDRFSSAFSRSSRKSSSDSASSSSPAVDTSDPLQALISLQTFVGSWTWTNDLEKVLGVTAKKAGDLKVAENVEGDVLATLCAVVFLKKKLADEKETWEMVVEKAEDWLREQVGDLEEAEKAVEGLY